MPSDNFPLDLLRLLIAEEPQLKCRLRIVGKLQNAAVKLLIDDRWVFVVPTKYRGYTSPTIELENSAHYFKEMSQLKNNRDIYESFSTNHDLNKNTLVRSVFYFHRLGYFALPEYNTFYIAEYVDAATRFLNTL